MIPPLALLALLCLSACAGAPPAEIPAQTVPLAESTLERITDAPGLDRFYRISDTVYRGAQPDAEGYRELRRRGVRTVISFRRFSSTRRAAESAGLDYVRIPILAALVSEPPEPEQVAEFLRIVRDPERQPVYIHCQHGRDRTGVMAAVYRMECQGWTRARALAEMRALGFRTWFRDLHRFVRSYPAPADER